MTLDDVESLAKERSAAVDAANHWKWRADKAEAEIIRLTEENRRLRMTETALVEIGHEQTALAQEVARLTHIIECADTPLMRDVLAERVTQLEAELERAETDGAWRQDTYAMRERALKAEWLLAVVTKELRAG